MNNQNNNPVRSGNNRLRFSYIVLCLSIVLLIVSLIYSSWKHNSEHEAELPICGIETVVAALRSFYQQTGRFPKDFRELDERIWKGAKREQISGDGKSLNAPASHYFYVLHVINTSEKANAIQQPKAGLWAVPTGVRASEAATHFWYITPTDIERWMGPALTAQNISAVKTIPTEQQLALLVMNKQAGEKSGKAVNQKVFPILGF